MKRWLDPWGWLLVILIGFLVWMATRKEPMGDHELNLADWAALALAVGVVFMLLRVAYR